jgi:hypothetical protein
MIGITSVALPKSPMSFAWGDEVPTDFYTKTAPAALRIFDHLCKTTFATVSPWKRTFIRVGSPEKWLCRSLAKLRLH